MNTEVAETIDPLRALDENGEFPAIWSPDPGMTLRGVIRRYSEVELEKSGHTWICTIQDAPDSVMSVFLSPTVLKSEFARKKPKVGERISIRYLGTPAGKNYKKYSVTVLDRDDQGVLPDWDQLDPDQRSYVSSVPDDRPGTPYASQVMRGSHGGAVVAQKPAPVPQPEGLDEDPFADA